MGARGFAQIIKGAEHIRLWIVQGAPSFLECHSFTKCGEAYQKFPPRENIGYKPRFLVGANFACSEDRSARPPPPKNGLNHSQGAD